MFRCSFCAFLILLLLYQRNCFLNTVFLLSRTGTTSNSHFSDSKSRQFQQQNTMYFLWFPHIMNAYCSLQGQAGLTKVGCLAICHFHLVMYILRHYFSFFMSSIFLAAYLHSAQPLPQWLLFRIFVQKVLGTNLNFRYHELRNQKK